MRETSIDQALAKSERWMHQTVALLDGMDVQLARRGRLCVSLYHLCIEHHQGIHILVQHGVCGSALALFRPQFESFVRAAWFGACASEKDIDDFFTEDDPPGVHALVRDLEKRGGVPFGDGNLGRIKKGMWDQLCSFTHGGALQVVTRNVEGKIEQSYAPEHICMLILGAASLSQAACIGIAAVVQSEELAQNVRDAYQAIYLSK